MENIEYINFINLSEEESKMVLEWRNHPSIRKWMNNTSEITFLEHTNFIKQLNNKAKLKYLLVKYEQTYLGVITIHVTNTTASIGLYKNFSLNKKGIGKILLDCTLKYCIYELNIKKITLYVKKNNIKALSLYKNFNFIITKEDNNYYYMELDV